jgi:hypothetical protein
MFSAPLASSVPHGYADLAAKLFQSSLPTSELRKMDGGFDRTVLLREQHLSHAAGVLSLAIRARGILTPTVSASGPAAAALGDGSRIDSRNAALARPSLFRFHLLHGVQGNSGE